MSSSSTAAVIDDLVLANHILVAKGILDAFGHVSARDPEDPQRFLISRNLAPASVTADDIQRYDLDGVTQDPRKGYLERFLHAEIFRARPDVQAVVHSHAAVVLPFTVADRPLKAVSHMGGFLGDGAPVFEIRDVAGAASDLLVSDAGLGRALAGTLGESAVALMRGHGSVVVGSSVAQAVFRAVYLEFNARVYSAALALGEVTTLTAQEATAAAASNDGQVGRAWAVWQDELRPRQ